MSVVLAVRAGYIPAFGGNVTINYALFGMQALAAHFGPSSSLSYLTVHMGIIHKKMYGSYT
jgi:hypothetical protein